MHFLIRCNIYSSYAWQTRCIFIFDLPRASQNTEGSTSSASIYQPPLIVSRLLAIFHLLKNPVLFFFLLSHLILQEKKHHTVIWGFFFPLYCTTVLHGECVCIYTQVVSVEIYVRNGLSSSGKHTAQTLPWTLWMRHFSLPLWNHWLMPAFD